MSGANLSRYHPPLRSFIKRTTFETRDIDLNELMREVFDFLSVQASARNVALCGRFSSLSSEAGSTSRLRVSWERRSAPSRRTASRVMEKAKVHSLAELVSIAERLGILAQTPKAEDRG
jgi:hypothetical protein